MASKRKERLSKKVLPLYSSKEFGLREVPEKEETLKQLILRLMHDDESKLAE
ncbi:MAG: hypothetical protein ACE5JA_10970 [bacterium]